jgi:hypothetical protein
MDPRRETRVCASCGRSFGWHRRWARNWDEVRYCSRACRGRGVTAADRALEAAILELLGNRAAGATICPSEAARRVRPDDWRDWMEPTRRAARRLVARGELRMLQKGRPVDPDTAKGPVRLGRPD